MTFQLRPSDVICNPITAFLQRDPPENLFGRDYPLESGGKFDYTVDDCSICNAILARVFAREYYVIPRFKILVLCNDFM